MPNTLIHPSAEVSQDARLGDNVKIWHGVQIREHAQIGDNCIIGKNVYIDVNVSIGANCKIQNHALIYQGVTLENGVFIGPAVCFTNDRFPRAVNPDESLKRVGEWEITPTLVKTGASIGANATILPGITIGKWAMVGAGSVVTHDVPAYSLVYGNPARLHGKVDKE